MKGTTKRLLGLLSFVLFLTSISGFESKAEELTDVNPDRLEAVYGMDEEGNIFEVDPTPGLVEEVSEEVVTDEEGIETFAIERATTPKVVNFNTKGNAVTNYTEYGTGASGYTNGAYGADGAYLGKEDGKVIFMLSGVIGKVNASEVQVVDYSSVKMVSYYIINNGKLTHRIAHKVTGTSYSSLVYGPAPSYLSKDTKYYSYDGHYFYKDYATMSEDYQNETRINSVNPNNPFYNYFQYLPLRSQTNYTNADMNTLINNKVTSTSKMRNQGEHFGTYQNTYGVNALLMTAVGANESGWGTSSICNNKNNLFGISAVDTSPSTSAKTFESIKECIRQFAETYMSKRYLRPGWTYYHGGFLGNKASGINVSYASDPYWGEKAANIAWTLDSNGGNKDYVKYTIGIKDTLASKHNNVNVRSTSSTSSTAVYKTGPWTSYAVLLQKSTAENGFYKIQSDGVLNSGRTGVDSASGKYDFAKMYAYISDDYVTVVQKGGDVTGGNPGGNEGGNTGDETDKVTYTRYKVVSKVNYRTGAGTSYTKAGELAAGTIIEVEDGYSKTANGHTWVRFVKNGKTYYVAKTYLSALEVVRISGKDRYLTSTKVADEYKKNLGVSKFSTVIVASGESFADALSGSYLAGKKNAPMLLTTESNYSKLFNYLKTNLKSGGTVYILGGEGVLPDSLEKGLTAYKVKRLSGKTRYDTNLAILKEAGVSSTKLIACYGETPYDSLSASASGEPILLVNKTLSSAQKKYLGGLSKKEIYVLGGTGVISTALKKELKAYSTEIERISGADRYSTSARFAAAFFPKAKEAVLAYGENFPDGLSGGPLAMSIDGPVILAKPQNVTKASEYVKGNKMQEGYVLGGATLVTDVAVRTIFGLGDNISIPVK